MTKRTPDTSFDPFGDATDRGYLRNIHRLPAGKRLKDLEHQDFIAFLPDTLAWLSSVDAPDYSDLLNVHRELFVGLYPWAGQDRYTLFPNSIVNKGATIFALSNNIQRAFEIGCEGKNTPGQTLGHWAYAHPFLEGNGRALFTFFDDRMRRQGLLLDWPALNRFNFLKTLDQQIAEPESNALDLFFAPHFSKCSPGTPSRLTDVSWRPLPKP